MKTKLYNLKNQAVGEVDLPDQIFARPWNPDLVHQVLLVKESNQHKPWAHTKTRGEVRGGGRKPWKQKHTGRARHGSTRSPLWVGGGVTFGPRNERNYERKINKKMVRAALYAVLSRKLNDSELKVVDSLKLPSHKTKELAAALKNFKTTNALLIPAADNKLIFRASANISKVKSLAANSLNVKDVLQHKDVLIDQNALKDIK